MNQMQLNLARKWRSKQFDDLIGQKLAIRVIKNSLYRNLIFPAYLLSGTRGCGKTSMARLFAAALNCSQLELFQENPQNVKLPCLSCTSCNAMQQLHHPDFIEIDAASNTGVDTMRHIIDTASFVPLMGRKKIYLIDEAHMLSKAAFNSLLKILEEPPISVVFMLATTDHSKIIDTVKSRCFQLFFNPIENSELINYLEHLCRQEKILYDVEGLSLVAQETEGSVRDAINLIERVRLANESITKSAVTEVLGFIDDEQLMLIFKAISRQDSSQVLQLCAEFNLGNFNAILIWKKFIELIRVGLWKKNGLAYSGYSKTLNYQQLESIINDYSQSQLLSIFELCCSYELLLSKSSMPSAILEMMFVKLSQLYKQENKPVNNVLVAQPVPIAPIVTRNNIASDISNNNSNNWQVFIKELEKLKDPLVIAIFKQALLKNIDTVSNTITLEYGKNLAFMQDSLSITKSVWKPALETIFGSSMELIANFNLNPVAVISSASSNIKPDIKLDIKPEIKPEIRKEVKNEVSKSYRLPNRAKQTERKIDVSDEQKWSKANLILKIFPGIITAA